MASTVASSVITSIRHLGGGPLTTLDPFLFCVYHKDNYPRGGPNMEVVGRRGNGQDFNQTAPYRFYHGETVPGFPQHPHRGFETITATIDGIIDHADSAGNAGRYGKGDLQCVVAARASAAGPAAPQQALTPPSILWRARASSSIIRRSRTRPPARRWLTAGAGVCHSEMFPLVETEKPNPTRFFQIWLNLPRKSKMAPPAFVMHWANDIPKWRSEDGLAGATVWAGSLFGLQALPPTPKSWAREEGSDIGLFLLTLAKGAKLELPPCAGGAATNRALYIIEGPTVTVAGREVRRKEVVTMIQVAGDAAVPIEATNGDAEVLVMQGRPIGEPVVQYGPFVMNTQEEIAEAFSDYRRTRFGGWPWHRDDMVFPREKSRFALVSGAEQSPAEAGAAARDEL